MLEFFPTAEGYVKDTVVGSTNNYNYVYHYKDHLGNVRISYTVDPADSVLKILEENHYYPFGLKHESYSATQQMIRGVPGGGITIVPVTGPNDLTYNYRYNGKEEQKELGLNMYDYGARFYDPATGRWFTVDQLAEEYYDTSSYAYTLNNPIIYIDPDGNQVEMCCDGLVKFLRRADRAADHYGEKIMRGFANMLPPVAATNAIKGGVTGTNIYGQTVSGGQIATDAISTLPAGKIVNYVKIGLTALNVGDAVDMATEKPTGKIYQVDG